MKNLEAYSSAMKTIGQQTLADRGHLLVHGCGSMSGPTCRAARLSRDKDRH